MKLSLTNIQRIYRNDNIETLALKKATINIQSGDSILIYGPSGSGKSTLLNIIGLIDSGYQGNYLIDGVDAKMLSNKDKALMRCLLFGFIFQEYELLEDSTVYENIKVPLLYAPTKPHQYKAAISNIVKQVGLDDVMCKSVKYLSGGQRQRVAIARSLVNRPKIILADEPTGSLDEANREIVLDIIHRYCDESTILLFVTHDIENNFRPNQKLVELRDGVISVNDD